MIVRCFRAIAASEAESSRAKIGSPSTSTTSGEKGVRMMKHVGLKAAVAFSCAFLGVAVPAAADTVEVLATDGLTFDPPDVTINEGDSVHWTGLMGIFVHTVAEVDDENAVVYNGDGFHSAVAASEFTFTFTTPGLYHYICEPHVAVEMRGTVTVIEPPPVPTVSTWGMATLVLFVLVAGTVVLRRVKLAT